MGKMLLPDTDVSCNNEFISKNEENGLHALVYSAQSFNLPVDVNQLRHLLGQAQESVSPQELCRCAKWIGLRASYDYSCIERSNNLPLFSLLKTTKGWLVLVAVDKNTITLYHPATGNKRSYKKEVLENTWTGEVIFLAEAREALKTRAFGLSWFFPTLRKHIAQFRSVLLVSLMMQFIALASPVLFENVIDRVLVSRGISSLQVLGLAMLALAIFEPFYGHLRSWLFAHLASKVNAELSTRLYQHLVSLPLGYFQQRQTGEIIARVREMGQIRQFLTGSALTLLLDMMFVGLFLAVMLFYSEKLTYLVLISLVTYFLFWLVFGPVLRSKVQCEYELRAENTAFLTESVTGIETIKTTATESHFIRSWEKQLSAYIRASLRAQIAGIWATQGIGLVQKFTSALLLWVGVNLVMSNQLTPGELVAFNMFSGHVTQPILRLAQVWQDFQHTLISLRRVGDILDEEDESGSGGLASVPKLQGSVSFKNVRFRYEEDGQEVLQNINLDIKPGEFVGITGPSGCGKSTLTRLMQRLYIPQHGQVLIDGTDLAVADPVTLRRNMSVVLQESTLFAGTISENIRIGNPTATDNEVQRASEVAGAHEFIEKLPQGYRSQVGERGSLLSGGQRQRIALARALITQPRILLLDEATSALDYESEAAVVSNMGLIREGRTVISIAHRLNTLRIADRILVIDDGKVVENGSHEELLALDGQYAQLWKLQMGDK
ncbi:type I secretion system permease/ATPase [Vibrio vulnificus]|nr:type I secretion system permease/ATPase [Vibrio vulnificus]EIT7146150.1 type I secretion system permease/ATPase [Vibrio vulnificus]